MQAKYFNIDGKELILGVNITTPLEAPYITTNPNDLVFKKLPTNKSIKIVGGVVTLVDALISRTDLISLNKELRISRIRSGISITGTFRVNGEYKAGHTETIRITNTLKADVMSILVGFGVAGETDSTALEVSTDIYLVISNLMEAQALFSAGKRLITSAYALEEQGRIDIRTSTEENLPAMRKALKLMWSQITVTGTL